MCFASQLASNSLWKQEKFKCVIGEKTVLAKKKIALAIDFRRKLQINQRQIFFFARMFVRIQQKWMIQGMKQERSNCGPGSLAGLKPRQQQQRASVLPHTDTQAGTASFAQTLVKS